MSSKSKDYVYDNIDVFDHIPDYLRNDLNSSFSRNLFNKFLTKDESIPVYGLIGNKSLVDTDTRPLIPQATLERKINSLIPMIYAKHGTTESVFSFSDIINKAKLLGINVEEFSDWGACQSFNFAPPIDIDKFINFSNYYWCGKLSGSSFKPSWNVALDPEFYVIAKPAITNRVKFPVEIASTSELVLTGSGHVNEDWIITFTSATAFTVVGETSGLSGQGVVDTIYGGINNEINAYVNPYITFKISNGTIPFQIGDSFIVKTEDLTETYSFTYNGTGNGGISGVRGAQQFQLIAGVQTYNGQRVLVKNQQNSGDNGIYVVRAGDWERASDCVDATTLDGVSVMVSHGSESGLWEASEYSISAKTFVKISDTIQNITDWTQFNYWIHRDDADSLGININETIQAKRPIIEYAFDLELNTDAQDGQPLGSNVLLNAQQKKHKFNQLPMFNLYQANGEFAGKVSAIFFYEEDSTSEVDVYLKRRIKLDTNSDFIFGQGCVFNDGMLFYKKDNVISSIWAAGPTEAIVTPVMFNSAQRQIVDAHTSITISSVLPTIKNAYWLAKAITPTVFSLSAAVYPEVNTEIAIGETRDVFDSLGRKLFTISIVADGNVILDDGVNLGDSFKFKTLNSERPRYVAGETLSSAVEVAFDDDMTNGVWTTPFQLEFNTYHENRKNISFGDLINHFKSIIASQPGIAGSAFGRNNFRHLPVKNLGYGGKIKEHNGAFNKFVGLINQENISPVSIIDFAETQYAQALNSVNEYVNKYAIDFLTAGGSPSFTGNFETTDKITKIVDGYCEYYKNRVDVASYLSSSTSVIPNWPATLPALGLAASVIPKYSFDNELGINVIVHHDGHLSPKNQRNVEFDRGLTKQQVLRSDGSTTAGVFSSFTPTKPYMNQLWFNSTTGVLKIFEVISDKEIPSAPAHGDYWFKRDQEQVVQWDETQFKWVDVVSTAPWKIVETEKILNAFILEIETRLYDSIHPNQKRVWDTTQNLSDETLKFELAKFAAKYGYDQFAPDYIATDAFTWNYKNFDFPAIGTGTARWHEVYKSYFAAATGTAFTTCRPNLEPWKLFGFNEKPANFDAQYAGQTQLDPALALTPASVVLFDELADVQACPNVIDGRTLTVGERVVVALGSNAGIYVVDTVGTGTNGTWSFAADFNPQTLVAGNSVVVLNGAFYNNTVWYADSQGAFVQARRWKLEMWQDIQNAFPSMKLCVNVFNEQLLPPFVDASSPLAAFALTNLAWSGAADSYVYGDSGPTETVWKKSLEHSYSLLRSGMKNQPLLFIESTWGDVYRIVNGLKLDKQAGKKLSHKEFILHGEHLSPENRARIIYCSALPTTRGEIFNVKIVCDYVTDEEDFFKVFIDGEYAGRLGDFSASSEVDLSALIFSDEGFGFEIGDSISFTVDGTNQGAISEVVFTPADLKVFIGTCQWFTQLLKFNSYSTTESRNNTLFRKWDVNLGYRFGAFMNTDTLKMNSNAFDIPLGICKMLTKVSPYAGSTWINALRIQLVQTGSTALSNGIYKPAALGADWVFRVETYFNKHPKISYYEVDSTGEFLTFNALEQRRSGETWKNFTAIKSVKSVTTPLIITGIQEVVNFLFGYTRYLEDSGWKINSSDTPDIDAETGRIITWQLEIEKFIDATYNNMSVGNGVIIDPFLKNVWFSSPQGLVSKFETVNFLDVSASQFAYDISGGQIPVDQLKIIREEDSTSIFSDTPMFGVHLNVEHYEHAVLFPYYLDNAKKQKLVFDPFLGMKLQRILLQGSRQAVQSARPSFGGFFLNNGTMRRNIVSSIDDLGKLYDAEAAFNNPVTSKYALALFGFSDKEYFTELGTSKKTQFNFWRGMIQAKGTNASVDSFLNNVAYEDAKIDEYWAFKIAEYGDARTHSFPELKLLATDSLLDTTRFQFNEGGSTVVPGFTQVSPKDESRWINLDDINELKDRGMYFDAISLGKIIVKEKPMIDESSLSFADGSGLVQFVAGKQVVKTFMNPATVTVQMIDYDNFTVAVDGQAIGSGILGLPFSCSNFEFTIENDYIPANPGDSISFNITDEIFSLVKLPFISDKLILSDTVNAEIVSQNLIAVKKANISISVEGYGPQKPKFSPLKFFDYKSDTFLGNIPFWHPAIGQHTPEAHEIINMISPSDPAKYNNTTQITNNPNFDMLKPWGSKEVGKVWWNTKRLDYVPYYDQHVYPDIEHRLSKWGAAAEYSSVEVYEWVESDVPPDEYDAKVLSDAQDQNIQQDEKKSGEAAISKLLTRSRTWNVRPIAWKKNEAAVDSAFFTSALFNKIRLTSTTIGTSTAVLNVGRFTEYGLNVGNSMSAWDFINNQPIGQAQILTGYDYVLGAEFNTFTPSLVAPSSSAYSLSIDKSKKASSVGTALGKIKFGSYQENGGFFVSATEINTGRTQSLPVSDLINGTKFVDYDFTELGVKIRLTVNS